MYSSFGKDCVSLIFAFFWRLASVAKLKFAMISVATLIVLLALKVKKRKNRFSVNSQNRYIPLKKKMTIAML